MMLPKFNLYIENYILTNKTLNENILTDFISNATHFILDIVGIIPGIGEAANVANAIFYFAEALALEKDTTKTDEKNKKYFYCALSLIAVAPVGGDFVNIMTKYLTKLNVIKMIPKSMINKIVNVLNQNKTKINENIETLLNYIKNNRDKIKKDVENLIKFKNKADTFIDQFINQINSKVNELETSIDKFIEKLSVDNNHATTNESFKRQQRYLNEAIDVEMATVRKLENETLEEYLARVLTNDTKQTEKEGRKLPHIHPSVANKILVQIKDEKGEIIKQAFDIEKLKIMLKQKPDTLLRQNSKMKKSCTEREEYFNTTLPALKGLAIDYDTDELFVVDTCPSAGKCLIDCYARGTMITLYDNTSFFQHKTLSYLLNEPEIYENQLIAEIKVKQAQFPKKKIQIRWNDSGDMFSEKFFKIVLNIVSKTPEVDHYIYTKEVRLIKQYMDEINPFPSNVIINFSYGARRGQEMLIDKDKDKVSIVVDWDNKDENLLSQIKKLKLVKKDEGKWKYNNKEEVKNILKKRYNIKDKEFLTIDELKNKPEGNPLQYNVMVLPGESDIPASRRDVHGTYLFKH
jgi:hypothetical protein